MSSPYGLPAPDRSRGRGLAIFDLVALAILLPVIALVNVVRIAFTGTATLALTQEQIVWLIIGLTSTVAAITVGIIAVTRARRRSTRVVAGVAIVLGVFGLAAFGPLTYGGLSAFRSDPTPLSPPTCGPDSHPAVLGPDSRYTPCDDDLRPARVFANTALPILPTTGVDAAAIDELAASDSYLAGFLSKYVGTVTNEEGQLEASWVPTPVTCANFTWNGTTWDSEIVGALADGGCVNTTGSH